MPTEQREIPRLSEICVNYRLMINALILPTIWPLNLEICHFSNAPDIFIIGVSLASV